MRTVVIQNATGIYKSMLYLTAGHHYELCRRYDYSYQVSHTIRTDRHPVWERVYLIRDALRQGYERIVWIDADALWLHGTLDTQQQAAFGMVWHHNPMYDHYNAGVMHILNRDGLTSFVDDWENSRDDGHQWKEQHCLNLMLKDRPFMAERLGYEWNSLDHDPDHRSDSPRIVAWHGRPELACEGIIKWLSK
jgi:hypothetical protein